MTDSTRHILKTLLLKLLLSIAILAILDLIYYYTLYQRDIRENCSLMGISMQAAKGMDIVYLGESSNHSYSEDDTDKRFINQMIEALLPGHHVGKLSKGACHAGIFYDILRNIPDDSDVKTAIVTVNMRSFTSEWIYSNLEPALRKEQIMMKKAPALYKRMLMAFKAYPSWTEKERLALIREGFIKQTFTLPHSFPYQNAYEWDRAVGVGCTLYDGRQPSMDSVALACHHIKHFACTLNDKNPRIKDFDKIVKLCKRRGWQPVFNILAENVDQIDSLCGPDLLYLLEQNVQYVTNRYESQGVIVVNNLKEVRDKDFFDRDFPTEHYDQTGRRTIAENVADILKGRLR